MIDLAQRSEKTGDSAVSRLADRVFLALRLDRIAGGRSWAHRVPVEALEAAETRRAFRRVRILLSIETVVGALALGIALVLSTSHVIVPLAVWIRATAVLMITLSLFVFAWRAQRGWWWAFSRLSLFSVIFPGITVALALIPGLYPTWMIVEQVIFAAIMIGVAVLLRSAHMRAVFRKPQRNTSH